MRVHNARSVTQFPQKRGHHFDIKLNCLQSLRTAGFLSAFRKISCCSLFLRFQVSRSWPSTHLQNYLKVRMTSSHLPNELAPVLQRAAPPLIAQQTRNHPSGLCSCISFSSSEAEASSLLRSWPVFYVAYSQPADAPVPMGTAAWQPDSRPSAPRFRAHLTHPRSELDETARHVSPA